MGSFSRVGHDRYARNMRRRIVICPDSFKGTCAAADVAAAIARGWRSVRPGDECIAAPMADGGEGTSELFEGERVTLPTTDAAGRLTEAT